MPTPEKNFKQRVEYLVSQVPAGLVTTYGDLAAMAGQPTAARIVGGIAHFGDSKYPWHRVVNAKGTMARGYPGGMENHAKHLMAEGVKITMYKIDNFESIRWQGPNQ